jgi:hypothetical protein
MLYLIFLLEIEDLLDMMERFRKLKNCSSPIERAYYPASSDEPLTQGG